METRVTTESKNDNPKLYWMITFIALVACVTLILFAPEWFWLTLPFLLTFFVKALDMI